MSISTFAFTDPVQAPWTIRARISSPGIIRCVNAAAPKPGLGEIEAQLRNVFTAGLEGDAVAYRTFLDELSVRLRGFLRRRLASAPADIEDVLQETLLAVHNARHTYRSDQPLTAWVYAIARYKIADFLRLRSRRQARDLPLDAADEMFGACETEPLQAQRDVTELLGRLPARQRLPITHMKLEGLSVSETARLTGMSESAVKVGVHRGLKALAMIIRTTT